MKSVRPRSITAVSTIFSRIAVATAMPLALAASGFAGGSNIPDVSVSVSSSATGSSSTFSVADFGDAWQNSNGNFGFVGGTSQSGDWALGWSMLVNTNPFVIANLVVTNNSAMTSLFTLTVTLPIGVTFPDGTFMGGSVTGSITDLNGNGATLSSPTNGSLYTAFIDGNEVATLLDDPFTVTAGNFESAIVGPDSFGNPIPGQVGPPAFNTIAIELAFLLSPGDSASFTSIFVIAEIPAPAGVALFAICGLFGSGRRRRR